MARRLETSFQIDGLAAHTVVRFEETHRLGAPPALTITARFDGEQEIDAMIGQPARLSFGFAGEAARVFTGIVEAATVNGSAAIIASERTHEYALRVVPRIGILEHSFGSRIFQDLDVKEIVERTLKDGGVPARGTSFRLRESYAKRTYCVQYQESALAFLSRLLEEEGIHFFVEPGDDGEVVVFADDSPSASPIEGDPAIPVIPKTALLRDEDAIYRISERRRVRSGKFVIRDHNFEKPDLDLTATATADAGTDLEVYDYPGHHADPAQGDRRARVRLEAEQVERSTISIEAVCPRLSVGRTIKVEGAGSADGDHFVTGVVHAFTGGSSGDGHDTYAVKATLIPAKVRYRSPRRTPWPVIDGPQTARVVAPAGSPPESIHTDKMGRCKVKFHWDRAEAEDDRASCWMRVEQLQTSGSMVLPRVGWEVIVEFLEGDPDRPIVTGRVYDGVFKPPYALPEGKTRTALGSHVSPGGGGSNEIRIEDKAGSEELMVHAHKNARTVAAGNAKKTVGNNDTSSIGGSSALTVGGDQTVKITKGCENSIGGGQTVSVGGNRTVAVNAVTGLTTGGGATISVGGNQIEMDGNPLEAVLALAAAKAVEFAKAKAGEAIAKVEGEVQGAVDQVMGPINGLAAQAQALGDQMNAVKNGDLSGVAGMVAGASGLPGASEMASALGGEGGGEAASRGGGDGEGGMARRSRGGAQGGEAAASGGGEEGGMATRAARGGGAGAAAGGASGGGGEAAAGSGGGGEGGMATRAPRGGSAGAAAGGGAGEARGAEAGGGEGPDVGGVHGEIAAQGGAVRAAANAAIEKGVGAAADAIGSALGLDGAGGGGESMANKAGPKGDVAGVDGADREKGPGHSMAKVAGAYAESVGALKVYGVLNGVTTSVAGGMKQHVGAAHVELALGNRSEAIGGAKTESSVGLVVLSRGGESEEVGGAKTTMVGGAILDSIKGSHMVEAGGAASFVGAFHKIDASESITFQCGGSSVVIDGGGVTIASPLVTILSPKIQLPAKVTEV